MIETLVFLGAALVLVLADLRLDGWRERRDAARRNQARRLR